MSLPSTEALRIGYFFSAAAAPDEEAHEAQLLTPCSFSNLSLYRLRRSINGSSFTSLKVVQDGVYLTATAPDARRLWQARGGSSARGDDVLDVDRPAEVLTGAAGSLAATAAPLRHGSNVIS